MNRAEFISQAVSFEPMKMVVVSGPDQTATLSMLTDAAAAIEIAHPDYVSYAIDSRAKSIYSYRWPGGQDVDQSVVWEFKAVVSEPNIVVLVANEFDIFAFEDREIVVSQVRKFLFQSERNLLFAGGVIGRGGNGE